MSEIFYAGCVLVTKLCRTLATPRTVAHQAPLSMGFSRRKILEWAAISFSREKYIIGFRVFLRLYFAFIDDFHLYKDDSLKQLKYFIYY